MAIICLLAGFASAQIRWVEHNLSDVEVWDLNGIVFNTNLYVLAGYSGYQNFAAILTSSNGTSWNSRTIPTSTLRLQGVTFGNGLYVAVGSTFTAGAAVLTSPDGATWTNRTSNTQSTLNGIAWSGSAFVAVGDGGAIMTSTNGSSWGAQTSPVTSTLRAVIWAKSGFIAVGDDGAVLTSANGTSWTKQTTSVAASLKSVAWGGGQYCAVGDNSSDGSGMVITSPTGVTWTRQTSNTASTLSGVTFANSVFVAVGDAFNNQAYLYHATIIRSEDGKQWANDSSGTISGLYCITAGGIQFVAGGLNSIALTSPFATIGVKPDSRASREAGASHNAVVLGGNGRSSFSAPAGALCILYDMHGRRVFECRTAPHAATVTPPRTLPQGRYLASFTAEGVTLDRQVLIAGRP